MRKKKAREPKKISKTARKLRGIKAKLFTKKRRLIIAYNAHRWLMEVDGGRSDGCLEVFGEGDDEEDHQGLLKESSCGGEMA